MTALARIEPLGPQLGLWPKRTVPEALADILFGDLPDHNLPAHPLAPCATWAVLDAARLPNLPEELEASGLEHRCLFRGKAQADWGHVAPWLISLGRDARLTRRLFTSEAPFGLWDAAAAMFLRSRRTMDELWRHFRKYTRIQDEGGSWLYFRFWEAQSLRMLQKSVADLPEARRFFAPCELVLAPVPQQRSCLLIQPIIPLRDMASATTLPPTTLPPKGTAQPVPVHSASLALPLAQGLPRVPNTGALPGPGGSTTLPPLLLQQPLDDVRGVLS